MAESNCTSTFGQTPSFSALGSSSSPTSSSGSSIQQSQPPFGGSLFDSPSQFSFGTASAPAFCASITPAFGVANISTFGSTGVSPFTSSGGAFGGVSSAPVFGSSSPAFGAASTSASGTSSTGILGASSASAPSFNSGSTPPPFASQASTTAFGIPGFGQSSFGAQRGGSRVTPYAPTVEVDAGTATPGKLESISAMPAYKDKSYEELQWEDYQSGDKGGPAQGNQSAGGATFLFGQSFANPFSSSSTSNPYAPKLGFSDSGFGSSLSSPAHTLADHFAPSCPFGSTSSTSSLFSQTPAFPTTTPSMFSTAGTSAFGQKPSFGAFGSSSSPTSPFGSSIQQSQPAFGSSIFSSSSQPSFCTASVPAFGASITPAFGVANISPSRSTGISPLTSSGGAFGGVSSAPVFGSSSHAFGAAAASTPAFGSPSTGIFGASSASAPSFNFASTPAPFASQASTTAVGSPGFGQSSFGAQRGGSRVTLYAPTVEVDVGTAGKLESISAMLAYKDKSYEELRWEDYQSGDKGGPAQGNQSADGATFLFGQSFANPFSSSSTSNPFAPKLGFSDSGFGSPAYTPLARLAPSSPFGSTSSTSSLFSSQTPAFPTSTPSMFSTTGSSTFGTSNSLFGTSMDQGRTNAVGSSLNFSNRLALPLFELSTPSMVPAFFGPYTPTFGFNSSPASTSAFGSSSTGIFGASSARAPSLNFESTPAPFGQSIAFGTSMGQGRTNAVGSSLNFSNCLSLPLFQLSTPSMLPASFGQYTPTFGFNSSPACTPAFGSSSTGIFGASSARAPSFNFGSTPAPFGQSIAFGQLTCTHASWQSIPSFGSLPFGTTVSPFGGQANQFASHASTSAVGSPGFGQSSFGAQRRGSRVTTYAQTVEVDAGTATPGMLESISAMPAYKDKSHEELRWEDYQSGDKGGPAQGIQSTSLFGQSSANPFSNWESMDSKCGEGKPERISGTVVAFHIGDHVLIACDGMWSKHGNPPKVDGYHFVKVCWVVDEVFIGVVGCLRTAFSIITSIVREFETDPPCKMKKIANMVRKRADRCGDCGFIIGGKLNEGTNLELWKVCRPADNLPYRSDRLSTGNMFIIGGGSTDALARVKQSLGGDLSRINQWNQLQIMDLLHEALLSASSEKENATGGDFNCVAVNVRGVNTFATSTPGNPSAENVGDRGYSWWKYDAAAVKPRWYEFKPN